MKVSYPFNDDDDLMFGSDLYLESYGWIDQEHWDKGFNDKLRDRSGVQWSKLMVQKSDVAEAWPFKLADAPAVTGPIYRTGAPGRPTSMNLVAAEHAARWDRGEARQSISAEAEMLAAWLRETHPDAPTLTAKTIRLNLAPEHRRRLAAGK